MFYAYRAFIKSLFLNQWDPLNYVKRTLLIAYCIIGAYKAIGHLWIYNLIMYSGEFVFQISNWDRSNFGF